MACHVVNLEQGMPTAAVARGLLAQSVRTARAVGTKQIKFIHGYGSSGRGGAIKRETHRFLLSQKEEGKIRDFIKGEEFSPFYEPARRAVALYPNLRKDSDYSRGNDGITIVIL